MTETAHIQNEEVLHSFIAKHMPEWCKYPLWLLKGPLGVGKTTFVKHAISILDPTFDQVQSPSYTLVNSYKINDKHLFHVDLYRLQDVDIADFGLNDTLGHPDTIVIIEWPEHARELPLQYALSFDFSFDGQNARNLTIHHE
jgi:tRNA threonylcarbamoyladenosine biosynthesis protein TsaE